MLQILCVLLISLYRRTEKRAVGSTKQCINLIHSNIAVLCCFLDCQCYFFVYRHRPMFFRHIRSPLLMVKGIWTWKHILARKKKNCTAIQPYAVSVSVGQRCGLFYVEIWLEGWLLCRQAEKFGCERASRPWQVSFANGNNMLVIWKSHSD